MPWTSRILVCCFYCARINRHSPSGESHVLGCCFLSICGTVHSKRGYYLMLKGKFWIPLCSNGESTSLSCTGFHNIWYSRAPLTRILTFLHACKRVHHFPTVFMRLLAHQGFAELVQNEANCNSGDCAREESPPQVGSVALI